MQRNITSHKKKMLFLALTLSVLFVLGIIGTVIFAIKLRFVLMGFSIAFVVAGFYGSPIAFIAYATARVSENLVYSVTHDKILSVKTLCEIYGISEKIMKKNLRNLIANRYLPNYLLNGDKLSLNTVIVETEDVAKEEKTKNELQKSVKCPFCGAVLVVKGESGKCPFCGNFTSSN